MAAAVASIVGTAELYVRTGSTISLTCIIQGSGTIPPRILFWFHNSRPSKKDYFILLLLFRSLLLLLLLLLLILLLCPTNDLLSIRGFIVSFRDAHSCFRLPTRWHFARNGTNNDRDVVQTAAHTCNPSRRRSIFFFFHNLI